MCGIAGIVNRDGARPSAELVDRMIGTLYHRGPDDSGVVVRDRAGLGHARLSIIDLEGGHQPMANREGTLWITFNGEIFNYIELRRELEALGHSFITRSDTEVILRAFEQYGEECVQRFNGQWAFAIWDSSNRRLFLSRDRLGVRPLYYTTANKSFLFGSEVKALLAHPDVSGRLNPRALDQIFTFWAPVAPATVFQDIYELPPAHSMVVSEGGVQIRRYWHPDYASDPGRPRSEEDYAAELLSLLEDATRIRLRADVPVGAYLSGGIDSTVITALIKATGVTELKTFSVAFDDAEFDERKYQDEVVSDLGTCHRRIDCGHADIARVFPTVIRHTERPILRTAPAPLFMLSQLVRAHDYKVVLTGEGSDEVLGGYDIFKEAKIRRFWSASPDSHLRPKLLRRLYPYIEGIQSQSDEYLQAFFRVRPQDRADPLFSHLPRWSMTSRLKMLFSDGLRASLAGYDALDEMRASLPCAYVAWDEFAQSQYVEASHLLPGYILSSQGDRVAMAHAVEGRFPFLDHRVVEFANRLPSRLKMKVLREKYLLKRATASLVPPAITRRTKQPYRAPDARSFIKPDCRAAEYVEELLSAQRIQRDGVFNPNAVQRLVAKARAGRLIGVKDNMGFVGVLSTQLWLDHFGRIGW